MYTGNMLNIFIDKNENTKSSTILMTHTYLYFYHIIMVTFAS